MKNRITKFYCSFVMINMMLVLSGCYQFETIDQPATVLPNGILEINITVGFASDFPAKQSYYSILLPTTWASEDSLAYSGILEGMYQYSSLHSDTMESQDPAPYGYSWMTFVSSDTVDTLSGQISFAHSIQVDANPGLYFLDYRLGYTGEPDYSYFESNRHPVWVGTGSYEIAADVYVDASGSESNSGLSASSPLKTISGALMRVAADSANPRKIFVSNGTYSSSGNGEYFPLYLPDYITISGESPTGVILDAEQRHIVMVLDSVETDTIRNLTITGGACCEFEGREGLWGQGTYEYGGGGIYVMNSQVYLENVIITNNSSDNGGGITTHQSNVTLVNVDILNNSAEHSGGGISFGEMGEDIRDTLCLIDCEVRGNVSDYTGGGISLSGKGWFENVSMTNNYSNSRGGALNVGWNHGHGSYASLTNVTMTGNSAEWGGALFIDSDGDVEFSPTNRCNIFWNTAEQGSDLGVAYGFGNLQVVVDTFTVLQPTDFHATPRNKFTFDIMNGKQSQMDQDLYISPSGANTNSGTTPNNPLKNISYANSIMLGNHTIYLAEGTYSPSTTGEVFPITPTSHIDLVGESETGVILDAEGQNGVFQLYCDVSTISNLSITGGGCGINVGSGTMLSLDSVTITGNTGGGMYVRSSGSVSLENVNIVENTADIGAGILSHGTLNMNNVLMAGNVADGRHGGLGGGALWLVHGSTTMNHTTIVDNVASEQGGGIKNLATATMMNSIMRDNIPDQYYASDFDATIEFSYSNVQAVDGQVVGDAGTVTWLEGNIDLDPQFCDPWESVYTLAEGSPCLGSAQNGQDMGAFTIGCSLPVGAIESGAKIPTQFALMDNYPNPFNPTTTIKYDLPEAGLATLTIYDIQGCLVNILQSGFQLPSSYQVQWNGVDDFGHAVSTGVYFARLDAGNFSQTIKMLMIK